MLHKDQNWRSWTLPELRRPMEISTVVICVTPRGRVERRDARCKLASPANAEKANGILSSACAEKFYASVSAFANAATLAGRGNLVGIKLLCPGFLQIKQQSS